MNNKLDKIKVRIFGEEVGILAYDSIKAESYFQYSEVFLRTILEIKFLTNG